MDHHCPWLNNCVGHFNHRYFFSFCLFMTMGCLYCSISSRDMFIDAYNAVEVRVCSVCQLISASTLSPLCCLFSHLIEN
ncbi:UNVERIFIED_CONTAM: hypothetical protein FKN15_028813 [Acipenser sinensis]